MDAVQENLFATRCVILMDRLHKEFGTAELDEAAIVGNVAHECAGFTEWHEVGQPTAEGGIGLAMWTASRRHLYEAFCAAMRLDPYTFDAGVEYLVHELKGTYHSVLTRVRSVRGLPLKVAAFERYYEGAGIVREQDRLWWANKALGAYNAKHPAPGAV